MLHNVRMTETGVELETSVEGPSRGPSGTQRGGRRYLEWWLYDLPPMSGLLRFTFYAGLFLLALDSPLSPLRMIAYYEATSPELFRSYGLIDLLGIPYIDPVIIRSIIFATAVAWVLAAIGFLSRWSATATAIGVTFLNGLFFGITPFNHSWILPTFALLALCFVRTNDRWSVDYHLRKWRQGTPQEFKGSLAETGLARKAFLVTAVGFYFAAGMTKMFEAGPRWADGHTIEYFAAERQALVPLGKFLAGNLWLCALLAVGSLTVELGAPAALFSRKARYPLIAGWTSLHLGIWLTVGPRYFENILCFALLIDWGAARRGVRERVRLRRLLKIPSPRPPDAPPIAYRRAWRGVAAAGLLLPLVAAVALGQLFWWPLTHVYMYSPYFSNSHEIRANHPRGNYHNAAAAQRIAREFLETRAPNETTEYFAFLTQLRLVGEGSEPLYLSSAPGIPTRKQWILTVVMPVLIEDFAAKPPGLVEHDPDGPAFPAQRLLLDYLPVFREHADPGVVGQYERLELTYPLSRGQVAIASVGL